MILCVVLGHVVNGYLNAGAYAEDRELVFSINNIINSFDMPLFMVISGCMYCTAYFDANGVANRKRIYARTYNYIGSYLIFSLIFGLVKVLASNIMSSEVVGKMSLSDLTTILIHPIAPYWYLYVLIEFYLLFSIPRLMDTNAWVMLMALFAFALCSRLIAGAPCCLDCIAYYGVFFYAGMLIRKGKMATLGKGRIAAAAFVSGLIVFALNWNYETYVSNMFGINLIVATSVSVGVWYAFKHLPALNNSFFRACGRHSFEIYMIHLNFTAVFRTVLLRLGVNNVLIAMVISTSLSTAAPMLFVALCKKLKIYDMFFRPVTLAKNCFSRGE